MALKGQKHQSWNWIKLELEYLNQDEPKIEKFMRKFHPEIPSGTREKNTVGWGKKYGEYQQRLAERTKEKLLEKTSDADSNIRERQIEIGRIFQKFSEKAFKRVMDKDPKSKTFGKEIIQFTIEPENMGEIAKVVKIGMDLESLAMDRPTDITGLQGEGNITLGHIREKYANSRKKKA